MSSRVDRVLVDALRACLSILLKDMPGIREVEVCEAPPDDFPLVQFKCSFGRCQIWFWEGSGASLMAWPWKPVDDEKPYHYLAHWHFPEPMLDVEHMVNSMWERFNLDIEDNLKRGWFSWSQGLPKIQGDTEVSKSIRNSESKPTTRVRDGVFEDDTILDIFGA